MRRVLLSTVCAVSRLPTPIIQAHHFSASPSIIFLRHQHTQNNNKPTGVPSPDIAEEHKIENDVYMAAKDQIVAGDSYYPIAPEQGGDYIYAKPHVMDEPEAAVYALAKDEMSPFADDAIHVKSAIFQVAMEDTAPLDERFYDSEAATAEPASKTSKPSPPAHYVSTKMDEAITHAAASKIRTSMLQPKPPRDAVYEAMIRLREADDRIRDQYMMDGVDPRSVDPMMDGVDPRSVDPMMDTGKDEPDHEHRDYSYVFRDLPSPKDDELSFMKGTFEATEKYASDAFQTSNGLIHQMSELNRRHMENPKPKA